MKAKQIQILGSASAIIYAIFIIWIYSSSPQNISEIASRASVAVGSYEIDKTKFAEGLRLFRADNFPASRESFLGADPEKRDAKTQFYIAYSFYRQGFGKAYNDDTLFRSSLEAANYVSQLDPGFKSGDPDLKLATPAELRAELQEGLEKTINDLNPMKLLRERK